jgi:integrase
MAGYKAALAGGSLSPAPIRRKGKPETGTLRWLCQEYFASGTFRNELSPRTKYVRRRELETVCETGGEALLSDITSATIRKAMDRRAHTPEAANGFLKAIRGLFKFAVAYEHVKNDPTLDIAKLRSKNPAGWHTWMVEEVRRFEARHPVGTKARLTLALLLYTGARRSDVVQIGRQHIRDGWLKFRVYKNHLRQDVEIEIPVLAELRSLIDATPEKGDLTFLISDHGRPWKSGDSFGNRFRDWCNEAGLPHCSPHGLRKAGASIAAENGATDQQLNAIFGWTDPEMAAHYTRKANRRRLAAEGMKHLVPGQTGNEIVPLTTPVEAGETDSSKNVRKNNVS